MTEPSLPLWVTILIGLLSAVLGSGGVAAIMKARADRKVGIAQIGIDEDAQIAQRWKDLVDSQVKLLVDPMRQTLESQERKIDELEKSVKDLQTEMEAIRTKYWRAITFIRILMNWIARHAPEDVTLPQTPAELVEDIAV